MKSSSKLLYLLFFVLSSFELFSQCSYSVVMYDSFGDGWNGGSLTVNVAGVDVGTYTITTGAGPDTAFFQVNTGDAIILTFTAGTYENECEYYIYNADNQEIYHDGANNNAPVANNTNIGTANCPACPMPYSLSANTLTTSSAVLSWTEGGSATTWNIELGATGFTPTGTPTQTGVTSNPYTYTGLTASTSYDYYVQADCGGTGTSNWAGPYTFTTACTTINAPYFEDFENSGDIPVCWTSYSSTGELWYYQTTNQVNGYSAPADHTSGSGYYAWADDSENPPTGDITLLSPLIDVSGLTVPQLVFWIWSNDNGSGTNASLSIDIWDGAGWNNSVSIYSGNTNGWEPRYLDLTSLTITGPVQIRFIVDEDNGNWYDDIALDDFEIRETPNCLEPYSLHVTNISNNQADLGWTEQGTATIWNIELGLAGFTPTGTPTQSGVTNPYTYTGLSSATSYEFYVQADCGSSQSSWVGPYQFNTASCSLSEQCAYSMILNDSYGDGWDVGSITVEQDGNSLGDFTLAIGATDTIDINLCDNSSINLIWNPSNYPDECSFEFYDPFGLLLYDFGNGSSVPAAGPIYSSTVYCTPPTCPMPSNLSASNITDNSVQLGWTENGTATTWNIEYGPAGYTQGTGTLISGTMTNPYNLNGLSSFSDYDFYVQADCGSGDLSYWAGPFSFSTLMAPISNPSSCEIGLTITDADCIDVPVNVTGVPGFQLGTDIEVSEVNIIIAHTFDGDLSFWLESPNGVQVNLALNVGGGGDNFGIIDGTCTQYTSFQMGGALTGTPPFVGVYQPAGNLSNFNDNSDPNGQWVLHICDNSAPDEGTLEFFAIVFTPIITPADVIINEVDADQSGTDTLEFVELYDGGIGNYPLDDYAVAFYNGSSDQIYQSFDLDGYTTNSEGYFVLGNSNVPGVDLIFTDGLLQNGADAVALYKDDATNLPIGTSVTTTNIEDAIVYSTNDPIDVGLLTLLNVGQPQVDEDGAGNKDIHSLSRIPNGSGGMRNTSTYVPAVPTPDAINQALPSLTWDTLTFTESLNNDGSIGNPINIDLNDDVFAQTGVLTEGTHYNSSNVPAGLTVQITVTNDTTAIIELIGNAVSHLNSDDINNLSIEFTDNAFTNVSTIFIDNYIHSDIIVDFFDTTPKTIVWSSSIFTEDTINDGSIADSINLVVWAETYTVNSGQFTENTHYTASNVPSGLSVEIFATGDSTAYIKLTGNATNHNDADDINNLDITFLDAAFTGNIASDVADYYQNNLIVDFRDPYITNISLSISPDTLFVCNGCVCSGPTIYLTNTGDLDIPQNDSIFIFYQYPPLSQPVEDTLILSSDLIVGDSVPYFSNINISQFGMLNFEAYITYYNDDVATDDTSHSLIYSYQTTVDLGGINDTIITSSYPYTLDAGPCSGPFTCTYSWSTTESTQTISVNTDGWYSITVTDANGCVATDSVYMLLQTNNMLVESNNDIIVYPNPNDGHFTIRLISNSYKDWKISIYNVYGKKLDVWKIKGKIINETFNFNSISSGCYYLTIQGNNKNYYRKIIVR